TEIRIQGERRGPVWIVDRVRRLAQTELVEVATIGIGKEGEAGTEPSAERRLNLRQVDADDDDPRIRHFELVLQSNEAAEVALLLGAPPGAREEERDRIAARELRKPAGVPRVIRKLEIGEVHACTAAADGAIRPRSKVSATSGKTMTESSPAATSAT